MTPLTTYRCGFNCKWRGVEGSGEECSDTTYYIQMYTDVALTVEGSAVTPLTTYKCGFNCKWRGVEGSAVTPLTTYRCIQMWH